MLCRHFGGCGANFRAKLVDKIGFRKVESPVFARAQSFQSNLVFACPFEGFYPNHFELDFSLAILQGEPVTNLPGTVNCSQSRAAGSYIEGMDEFRNRLIDIIWPPYLYREDHLYALLAALSDLGLHEPSPQFNSGQERAVAFLLP